MPDTFIPVSDHAHDKQQDYTGGYTIVANGEKVYSNILSNNDMSQLIASLGGTVVHLAEGGLNDHVTASRKSGSRRGYAHLLQAYPA